MLGLALEGGGAKGSYEIGSYVALKKLGYKFDAVAGTSIGSLNAALIAQKDIKLAKKLWLSANSDMVGINNDIVSVLKNFKINKENISITIKEIKTLLKNKGLDNSKYLSIIESNINESKIRNSRINYGLVTVKLKDLKPMELTINDIPNGKLSEYIMASSYLPIFKMNKIIDNSYYLDGGISNNLPVSILEKMGCKKIIAIKVDGIGRNKKKLYKDTEVIEIKPTKNTGPIIMFDNNDILNNYYMGYYDTLLRLNKIDGYKYYFKKFNYYKFLTRNVDNKLLTIIKIRFKSNNIKDMVIKSIEDILNNNNIYYYKVYSIHKILRFIKKNKLKSKSKFINDFVYKLKIFIDYK